MGRTLPKQKKGGVKVESNKTRYSYSKLTCFGHCKYEFYLDYVINDDEQYLSEGNYYAEVGSYVHSILEKVFKKEIKVEDALQYFIDNYNDNVCYKVKKSTMDKTFETICDYFAELNIDWIDNYDVLGVELEMKFKVNEYDFIGYIDLLLRDKKDGKIVVLDHKSSEYPFKQNGDIKKNLRNGVLLLLTIDDFLLYLMHKLGVRMKRMFFLFISKAYVSKARE